MLDSGHYCSFTGNVVYLLIHLPPWDIIEKFVTVTRLIIFHTAYLLIFYRVSGTKGYFFMVHLVQGKLLWLLLVLTMLVWVYSLSTALKLLVSTMEKVNKHCMMLLIPQSELLLLWLESFFYSVFLAYRNSVRLFPSVYSKKSMSCVVYSTLQNTARARAHTPFLALLDSLSSKPKGRKSFIKLSL